MQLLLALTALLLVGYMPPPVAVASEELKADRDIALAAVSNGGDPRSLEWVLKGEHSRGHPNWQAEMVTSKAAKAGPLRFADPEVIHGERGLQPRGRCAPLVAASHWSLRALGGCAPLLCRRTSHRGLHARVPPLVRQLRSDKEVVLAAVKQVRDLLPTSCLLHPAC